MEGNIVGIIPARGGSKGLPGKNIKLLGDKPLIAYTIEEAKKSKYLSKVIVSTDDEKISEISVSYGAQVPFVRPEELSTDTATSVDVLVHYLSYLKDNNEILPEYICLLQCTTPFRDCVDIDHAIQKCINLQADACVAVCESKVHPYWMVTIENDRMKKIVDEGIKVTRRQELPKAYRFNGGIYVLKTDVLLEKRTLFPENTVLYVMDENKSLDIDTELDFKICEMVYNEKLIKGGES